MQHQVSSSSGAAEEHPLLSVIRVTRNYTFDTMINIEFHYETDSVSSTWSAILHLLRTVLKFYNYLFCFFAAIHNSVLPPSVRL